MAAMSKPPANGTMMLFQLFLLAAVVYLIRETQRLERMTQQTHIVLRAVPSPPSPIPKPVTIVKTNEFHWAHLESEDYRDYIARLRAIGCPEETIRDIIIADVEKLIAPKLQGAHVPRK